MKVEILIYAYLAVCAAMIIFNIVCIFVFRKKDKNIEKRSIDFTDSIEEQFSKDTIDEEHIYGLPFSDGLQRTTRARHI